MCVWPPLPLPVPSHFPTHLSLPRKHHLLTEGTVSHCISSTAATRGLHILRLQVNYGPTRCIFHKKFTDSGAPWGPSFPAQE